MMIDPVYLAIAGMAAVTFAERAMGFYIAQRIPFSPRVKQTLESLPGVVLIAIVAPALLASGWQGWVGGAVLLAIILPTRRGNLAVFSGLAVVILLRAVT